ncbi:MAG: hypothetical protein SPL99_05375 [Catonella sp.]|nr:hypothetical protein [Catonella sp.]
MQIKIELLKKGDSVLNVWDNNIAIKRKNEDVEIFHYELGDDGLPRLSNNSILITKGEGVVKAKSEDGSFEVGTF